MPRIRTIKPEFWRNKQLASLTDFSRLVAIALLNIADDEGYFEADAMLIRGDVFPYLADHNDITVAIRELSRIGYVVVKTSKEKGEIGFIPTFSKHQVINKKSDSKLKCFYENSLEITACDVDSGSVPVVSTEPYVLEQGTGSREKEVEKELPPKSPKGESVVEKRKRTSEPEYDPTTYRFSGHLDTPEVHSTFLRYVAMRKSKGKRDRATLGACEQIEQDFQNYSAADLVEALGKSIVSSWNGVFPPTKSTKHQHKPPLPPIVGREMTLDEAAARF